MRAWIAIALIVVAACKGDKKTGAGSGAGSAPPPAEVDWAKCDQALDAAAAAPLGARPKIVIDGCPVCGKDWTPLLRWSIEPQSGGPRREDIEAVMVACNAFCTGDSKLKFMGTVDKARGTDARTPWRTLASACKEKVGAVPDDRFMSAPYFALDRIARATAARGGDTAAKAAALTVPLPAVTLSGVGVVLPDADAVSPSVSPDLHVTLLGDVIHVGRMPRGKLGSSGVEVDLGKPPYPGEQVAASALGAKLLELVGEDKMQTLMLLAPHAMPAHKLVTIIAAASAVAPVYLGAHAGEAPEGWQLAGAIPISLEAGGANPIAVTDEMTVQNLARELSAHVARELNRVGVTNK